LVAVAVDKVLEQVGVVEEQVETQHLEVLLLVMVVAGEAIMLILLVELLVAGI
jgi:hypothetical protein